MSRSKNRRIIYMPMMIISYILAVTLIFSGIYSIMTGQRAAGEEGGVGDVIDGTVGKRKQEIKAVWIASFSNINFPSKRGLCSADLAREIDTIVDNASALGANALFFQVRPCGDALYKSSIFPASHYVSGKRGQAPDGEFDSLSYLCERAHEKNIAVHAWVNPVRAMPGSPNDPARYDEMTADEPCAVHPDWVISYADGRMYYDLGIPEVRTLIADGVSEIVRNYSVDGVVFDDYFYPYPSKGEDGVTADFDDSRSYAVWGGQKSLAEYRRENVRALVRKCSSAVKKADKNCLFGISPFGIWKNSEDEGGAGTSGLEGYYDIYCDALGFAREGSVDYIAPQLYWGIGDKNADYKKLAKWWSDNLSGTSASFLPTLAAYRYESGAYTEGEVSAQIEYARTLRGVCGISVYGYAALTDKSLSVGAEVMEAFKEKEK